MKKARILVALLVLALLPGVAALHFRGDTWKKTTVENHSPSGTELQGLSQTEPKKPEVPSCTPISNTSFEPTNGVVGWWIKDGAGREVCGKDIEITPKVDLKNVKSYGKLLWFEWPGGDGMKPPRVLAGDT
ncbi:hypothetical protein [Thermococcus sp.]|uniref:hypothetical protein n=1 Tax=Thermococcus sp. TaxID=35749 RepID=UPI00262CE4E3|nr:hypothetical protein [Thermococcus sp.]